MSVTLHVADAKAQIAASIGQTLLRMAVTVQVGMMQRIGKHNPPPYDTSSQQGEYLKKRTGHLQAGILYQPITPEAVAKLGSVKVGYTANVFYGALWDASKKRKGLVDAVEELRGQLQALGGK